MALVHISDYQVSGSEPFVEVRLSLWSSVASISRFVDRLMSLIMTRPSPDGSEINIEIALHEALANAVVHGNHEDPTKPVEVMCRCSADGEVSITIRDQGTGFDVNAVPDPTTADNRLSPHGRGIYLMRALMDEVWFEDGGTVVHMRKKPTTPRSSRVERMR